MNATLDHGMARSGDITFGTLTSEAWRIYRVHWKVLAAGFATIVAAWAILEILVSRTDSALFNVTLHLLFLVVAGGLQTGFLKIALDLTDGRRPEYGVMFRHLGAGPAFFLAQLVFVVCVTVGLALLIVPGFYAGSKYGLFAPAIADRGLGGIGSLSFSGRITRGRQVELAILGLYLAVLNFFGAAMLGIGLLLTAPLSVLIVAGAYRRLAITKP